MHSNTSANQTLHLCKQHRKLHHLRRAHGKMAAARGVIKHFPHLKVPSALPQAEVLAGKRTVDFKSLLRPHSNKSIALFWPSILQLACIWCYNKYFKATGKTFKLDSW